MFTICNFVVGPNIALCIYIYPVYLSLSAVYTVYALSHYSIQSLMISDWQPDFCNACFWICDDPL